MKILFVYPCYPDTFWSFRYALKFISKKACYPPLGLLTVAAMLPPEWEKRLVDMNVEPLSDEHLLWADYVFISAMAVQRNSVEEFLSRCRRLGVRTVAGGPLFTACHADFPDVDHLVLNEAEVTLPQFLEDLEKGEAQRLYTSEQRADLKDTPIPLWELIDIRKYAAMNIQYSRGCPFDCEFCDITALFGRKPRTKQTGRLLAELESLRRCGWRGGVFLVDDNFIGDKRKLKREVLPALIDWMERRGRPFSFFTETSVDLADDPELMELMVRAGFEEVFVGIETPNEECLKETGKVQNRNRDLLTSVRRIQHSGLQVQGGFIVGFDSDPATIFESHIRFIQESGIVTAMVGLLTALRGTRLYGRLVSEGRLLRETSGNNTGTGINFIPRMNPQLLVNGYRSIISTIYSPKQYYRRLMLFLREYRPVRQGSFHLKLIHVRAIVASFVLLGIVGKERLQFWKLITWSLIRRPRLFPLAVTLAIYGYHFRKVAEKVAAGSMIDCGACSE
ncbi:DUF4070 domain-containing protein [bacterium]|nr:DUF4070 domain-containing protein [bacterium]